MIFHDDEPQPTEPAREITALDEAFCLAAFEGILADGPGRVGIGRAADLAVDAILATPEMQAIKVALFKWMHHNIHSAPPDMIAAEVRGLIGLPPSVADWVLS